MPLATTLLLLLERVALYWLLEQHQMTRELKTVGVMFSSRVIIKLCSQ